MAIYNFANLVQKRLRDVLRGSGSTSYLTHPDSSPPSITEWVIQGRPEKENTQEILVTVTKPEPTSFEDTSTDGNYVSAETELQVDLFVTGVSGSGSPRSDKVRRDLIGQINRTILVNKRSAFSEFGVKDLSFNHLDLDEPDNIAERHTVYRVTIDGEESLS